MDVYPSMQRRRLLRAALGAAALMPLACSRVPAAAMATPVAPELLPLGPQITPDLFLTVTSQERDATTLALLVSTTVLPVLAPADIAHAAGPVEGAIQLWLTLDPVDLQHHGLDVDGALALLTQTLKGNAGPVPGRHRLKAWAIDIPGQETVDAQQVTLPLPDHPYAPMFALGTTEYTVVPPSVAQPIPLFLLPPVARSIGYRLSAALRTVAADSRQYLARRSGHSDRQNR